MSTDASLRSRGNRRYVFADHGAGSSSFEGNHNHICKAGKAEVWKPAWTGGPTTIRILPQRSPDDSTQWDPFLLSQEAGHFGDWIRKYNGFVGAGNSRVTALTSDPSFGEIATAAPRPIALLREAIRRAKRLKVERPGWSSLLEGGNNRGAELPPITDLYLVQAGMFMQGAKNYMQAPKGLTPDSNTVVFMLTKTAGEALINAINEAYTRDPNFDPVAINRGAFATIYNLAEGDPRQQNQPIAPARIDPGNWSNRGAATAKGYGCFVDMTFGGLSPELTAIANQVEAKVKLWDEILWIPTPEEEAQLIADEYPADLCMYAWENHPEWITDKIRQKAAASSHLAVPGPQAYSQQYPPQPYGAMPQPQQGVPPQPMAPYGAPPQPMAPYGVPPQPQGAAIPPSPYGAPPQPEQPAIPASVAYAPPPLTEAQRAAMAASNTPFVPPPMPQPPVAAPPMAEVPAESMAPPFATNTGVIGQHPTEFTPPAMPPQPATQSGPQAGFDARQQALLNAATIAAAAASAPPQQ